MASFTEQFKLRLKQQANPVTVQISTDGKEEVFSATALWNLSLNTWHLWRRHGLQGGDTVASTSTGVKRLVEVLASDGCGEEARGC